ncbi:hypothetical protein SCHPADRAFT_233733 [Schizopora paradoxa]|uniref:Uncharacterized protein n=1 Tax=Schizopora paradoxa TaxID=27342 RepID=A0A0H2S2T3_9AGAM|nr:hypothetical protein SCHPADRAFT_233733 [Schizopora paradoxa]
MVSCPTPNSCFNALPYLRNCGPSPSSQIRVACSSGKGEIRPPIPSTQSNTQEKTTSPYITLPRQTFVPTNILLVKPSFLPSSIETYSRPGRAAEGDWKTHPLASAVEKFIIETVAMTTDPLALAGIEWSDDGATMANRFVRHGVKNLRR